MGLAKRREELSASELIACLRRIHMSSADLKALIELTHDFIGEDLERRLHELKASRDGASLPIDVLRSEITRNSSCMCRSALHHCEKEMIGNA
jgi:hypothetical protein